MARIKPKPMNRLPSGSSAPGGAPQTPTGTPGMIVSPGAIPMVAAAAPVQVAPVATPVSVANKNGYPRQQQQQQPPPQQPSVMPYAMMALPAQPLPGQPQQQQQVGMVQTAGSAPALPSGTGQPPNMVSMTTTTMAQTPYFVTSNNSAPNVHVSAPNYNGAPTIIYVSLMFLRLSCVNKFNMITNWVSHFALRLFIVAKMFHLSKYNESSAVSLLKSSV
jgi:hypothetical protein